MTKDERRDQWEKARRRDRRAPEDEQGPRRRATDRRQERRREGREWKRQFAAA